MAGAIHFSIHGGDLETGSPPLVLIHGSGGTRLHWPPQLRRLPHYRVFGLDLPGHGDSPGAGETTIEDYVRRVVEWLKEQGLERAVLAGHSMGGAIAMTAALVEPDHVAGLVLVGSGGRLRVNGETLRAAADPIRFEETVEALAMWAFSDQTPEKIVALAKMRMSETRPEVIYGDFIACNQFDILDRLSEIHVPTLILCGDQDRLTPLKYSRYMDEQIPESTLVLIEGAGHMVMLERPLEVTEAVVHFMARL
ncbi:MAG TPA: alpha/beta hydrolase [Anaerolineales bacterium]|nr:alpha/beta hydrolase [Anaerolineales bacterium]